MTQLYQKTGVEHDSGSAVALLFREVLGDALREDIGFGDLTSGAIFSSRRIGGEFQAKAEGVLAGSEAIAAGYALLDPGVRIEFYKQDGDWLRPGELIAEAEGPADILLSGERVILNLLQHLSGIATATAAAVTALQGGVTKVCDTRKTLPGLRGLQKYAVRCGGGYNHRMRLDDGVIIKDNHIIAAGGITPAVESVRSRIGHMVRIEVECETYDDVQEAVEANVDVIMLDNMEPEEVAEYRKAIPDSILVEISGGLTPENVARYKNCGADYVSMGCLTHSVRALDISFNIKGGRKTGVGRSDESKF